MSTIVNKITISNFRIKVIILVTVIFFCLSFFLYLSIQNKIKHLKENINNKFDSIASTLESEITDAKHVIYGLAAFISQESVTLNNERIRKLINNFDPRSGHDRSIPFSGIILLDKNNIPVANTVIAEFQTQLQINGHPTCLDNASKKFFELQINSIRQGVYIKESIIPMSMAISNSNKQYIGTICTGLIVRELNEKLSLRYIPVQYFDRIKLQNNQIIDSNIQYNFNEVETQLTIQSIFMHYFQERNILIHKAVENTPFVIEMSLKPAYLGRCFNSVVLFFIGYLLVFIISFYSLWRITNNHFQIPLYFIHKKLKILNNYVQEMPAPSVDKLCMKQFAQDFDELLNHYSLLKEDNLKQPKQEIKKKILNLVLTEQHFATLNRSNLTSEEKLYLNKLTTLIDEEYTNLCLYDFLKQISEYCCEFYYELKIKIIVQKKDRKNFIFKHAALTETIFHIFTFISRGNFDTESNECIIRGSFNGKNSFPSISIEASSTYSDTATALGWAAGPSYVYTSLLSIYLLSKENQLFFNIIKKDDKLIFILEPMDKKAQLYNESLELEHSEEIYL